MVQYRIEKADEVLLNGRIETVVDIIGGFVVFSNKQQMSVVEFFKNFFYTLNPYSKWLFTWRPVQRVEEISAV